MVLKQQMDLIGTFCIVKNGNVVVEYVDSPDNASDIIEEETANNDTQSDDETVENFNSEDLF